MMLGVGLTCVAIYKIYKDNYLFFLQAQSLLNTLLVPILIAADNSKTSGQIDTN